MLGEPMGGARGSWRCSGYRSGPVPWRISGVSRDAQGSPQVPRGPQGPVEASLESTGGPQGSLGIPWGPPWAPILAIHVGFLQILAGFLLIVVGIMEILAGFLQILAGFL